MSKITCTVRDGKFVEPCDILARATDNLAPAFSKAKGIFRQELTNTKTWEPSRTQYGIRTKEFPNGLLFNNCPFCGEAIDGPFADQKEEERRSQHE